MTAAEFHKALARVGLSNRGAARFFRVNQRTLERWLADGPSGPAAKLLHVMTRLKLSAGEVDDLVTGRLRLHITEK